MPDKKAPAGNPASRRRPNAVGGCPLTAALAAIGGKWKMILIYWLADEPAHFAARRRKMPGISQKVLTRQLRELEADAIVDRRAAARVPQPVVYSLTLYGRSLLPLIESVRRWGRSHLERHGDGTEPQGSGGVTEGVTDSPPTRRHAARDR